MDYIFLALTNPVPGREPDFNRWYNEHHVPEVVRYGRGFSAGRRYRLREGPLFDARLAWEYLALYTMVSDDLEAYHHAPWTQSPPPLTPFRGLVKDDHVAWIFRPAGPRRGSDGGVAESTPHALLTSRTLFFELMLPPHGEALSQDWLESHVLAMLTSDRGHKAAQAYMRAEHQRSAQADPPWQSLVIYEGDASSAHPGQTHLLIDASGAALHLDHTVCIWDAISECHVKDC
jgi:hypothetical protein